MLACHYKLRIAPFGVCRNPHHWVENPTLAFETCHPIRLYKKQPFAAPALWPELKKSGLRLKTKALNMLLDRISWQNLLISFTRTEKWLLFISLKVSPISSLLHEKEAGLLLEWHSNRLSNIFEGL
jgi:hypothetical protein